MTSRCVSRARRLSSALQTALAPGAGRGSKVGHLPAMSPPCPFPGHWGGTRDSHADHCMGCARVLLHLQGCCHYSMPPLSPQATNREGSEAPNHALSGHREREQELGGDVPALEPCHLPPRHPREMLNPGSRTRCAFTQSCFISPLYKTTLPRCILQSLPLPTATGRGDKRGPCSGQHPQPRLTSALQGTGSAIESRCLRCVPPAVPNLGPQPARVTAMEE